MPRNVTGEREIKRNLKRHKKAIRGALAASLYEKGFAIDAEMVPLIPVATVETAGYAGGTLRASHYVAPPRNKKRPVVQVGVGTQYAVFVHEREDLRHTPPTRSKFLEVVVTKHRRGYTQWLVKRTRRNWRRGLSVEVLSAQAPTRPKKAGKGKKQRRRGAG